MAGDFRLARGDVKRISVFHANGRFVYFNIAYKIVKQVTKLLNTHFLHAQFFHLS